MITRRVVLGGLIAGFVLGLSALAQGQAPSVLLLRGATIIDGASDTPLAGRSLLIEGNTIRAILPANAAAPAGAQIIDLTGKTVIPGLVESHVHWEDWMGELYVNHGVTSVVALENVAKPTRAKSLTDPGLPRIFHSGERPQFNANSTPEQIREAVQTWLKNEPDMGHFPTHNDAIARAYAIAAEEVHRQGFIIFGHAEHAPNAMRDGLDIVEHVWGFTQATMSPEDLRGFQEGKFLTWATFATDWNRLDAMIAAAIQRGAYLNPTLHYEWGGMSARAREHEYEDYRVLSNPDLVYFPRNIADSLLMKNRQIKNFSSRYETMPIVDRLPSEDRKAFADGYKNVLEFTRRWAGAGGKIHAGTDTITGGVPGLSLHHEMDMLVEAGLTPMQALKTASSWSAELLAGRNGARGKAKVGAIEVGNFADLVVLAANPLDGIANTKRIERVMKDGRWIELGYHPEYYSFREPARSISGATFAPAISAIRPSLIEAGSASVRVALEGSGFTMRSLVRIDGVAVKTIFRNPRLIEFDLPASAIVRPTPNPYVTPGPAQNVGVIGYRSLEVTVLNPPPEGGVSNAVHQMVRPK